MKEQRIVAACFTVELLADFLFNSDKFVYRIKKRLPEGAKLINSGFNQYKNSFYFIFQHESFEPVQAGMVAPEVYLTYESFDIEDLLKKKRRLEAFENAGMPVPKEEEVVLP